MTVWILECWSTTLYAIKEGLTHDISLVGVFKTEDDALDCAMNNSNYAGNDNDWFWAVYMMKVGETEHSTNTTFWLPDGKTPCNSYGRTDFKKPEVLQNCFEKDDEVSHEWKQEYEHDAQYQLEDDDEEDEEGEWDEEELSWEEEEDIDEDVKSAANLLQEDNTDKELLVKSLTQCIALIEKIL